MLTRLLLATALTAAPLAATAADWALDKGHASISFTVSHFGFSDVPGQFRSFDAEIDFDPENIEATQARFVIDAASFDTNLAARDEHVLSEDFLDVATYPTIIFVSTSVKQTGDGTALITGDLTIKDVTREVSFDAVLNKLGASPFDPSLQVAGFTITGEIDRTAFGVDAYAPAIGAVLPVTISFEISPASADNS